MRTSVRRLFQLAAVILLAAVAGAGWARAEVVAVLTNDGEFVRTEINLSRRGRVTSVWETASRRRVRGDRFERVTLNPNGGERGDGVPSIAIHPLTQLPWAVWSFNENGDAELAVSLFDGRNWSSPILLGAEGNGQSDVQPKLLFTPTGKPIIVWWRQSADGLSQSVWLTARSNGAWTVPMRLSNTRVRASRPTLLLRGDELIIAYDGDGNGGLVIRTVPLDASVLGGAETAGGDEGPDPPTNGDSRLPECQLIGCGGN